MKRFTALCLILSVSGLIQAQGSQKCEEAFRKSDFSESTDVALSTLRELALLRVEAENHPDDQMRGWLLKVVDKKVDEIIQGRAEIAAQILPKLHKLIEMARVSQTELSTQSLEQLRREIDLIQKGTRLNVLNLIQTPFRLHDLTRFDGSEASQPGTQWLTSRGYELPFSRGGIVFSKDERYMMLRPHYWTSSHKKTVIYDMKTRRPLKYAPRRGLLGPQSDYFAEVLDRHSMRIMDLATGKMILQCEGVPVPDPNAFTKDFIISRIETGRGNKKDVRFRLNLLDGRTLDLGKGFAIAANGNLLYLAGGRLKFVDAKTLIEIPTPSNLQGSVVITEKDFSQSMDLVLNGEIVRVFVDDLSSVKITSLQKFNVIHDHVELATLYTGAHAKQTIRNLKASQEATVEGEFLGFQENMKLLFFYDSRSDKTTLFDAKTFQTVDYPGRWDQITEDSAYLIRQGDIFRTTVIRDIASGFEQTFSKPGRVIYVPNNKVWLVHTFKSFEQIEVMLVVDPQAVELGHRISWTHEGVGISPSRRYWTVVENEQVRILEIGPPR